jgi:hypothetical protein
MFSKEELVLYGIERLSCLENTIDWKDQRSVKQRRKRVNVTTCTASAHSFFDAVVWSVVCVKVLKIVFFF